jgi:predicted DNA-binding transcriptional regulator AlpA
MSTDLLHRPPQLLHAADGFCADLLDRRAVCAMFGGINPSTLYRGIRVGRYPRPIKVGPGSSRWLASECREVLRRMTEARS